MQPVLIPHTLSEKSAKEVHLFPEYSLNKSVKFTDFIKFGDLLMFFNGGRKRASVFLFRLLALRWSKLKFSKHMLCMLQERSLRFCLVVISISWGPMQFVTIETISTYTSLHSVSTIPPSVTGTHKMCIFITETKKLVTSGDSAKRSSEQQRKLFCILHLWPKIHKWQNVV